MNKLCTAYLTFLFIFVYSNSFSQQHLSIWSPLQSFELGSTQSDMPAEFKAYKIADMETLARILQSAPLRFSDKAKYSEVEIALPMPNGTTERFKLLNSPVMESGLAAKYPQLKTFTGISIPNPNKKAKITIAPQGLFAMVLGDPQGAIFIRPFSLPEQIYYSFYAKDLPRMSDGVDCGVEEIREEVTEGFEDGLPAYRSGDCQLRQYRLALACTGEYAQFYNDDDNSNGDIMADALATMVAMINQVNGILEQEIGATLIIIDQTTDIIFIDPDTDPYTNQTASEMINENVPVCTNIIGNSNFDIGHVFGQGGGGIAFINSPCTGNKARGVSKANDPIGDPSDLKTAAHEFGHQFGARHTQNNDCNRSPSTCYEPGSGSTIMSYAGICSPSVQPISDFYYHAANIEQMNNFLTENGNTCATILDSSNQHPTADAGSDYTIPISTPFVLTANGTDPDGDLISYTWEQFDKEIAPMPPLSTSTIGPSFRSFTPSVNPERYFPRLEALIGLEPNTWEVLPSVSRPLNFRLTVRDNNSAYGCTAESDMTVFVDEAAGPFAITYPNNDTLWSAGEAEVITWDVANTDNEPINCANVDIFYSLDGGLTYPNVLATDVPNNGSYSFAVPDEASTSIRFMVKCSDNIFFAISEGNISIGLELFCQQFNSTDIPIIIAGFGMRTITSELNVDLDRTITAIKVINLEGTHEYISDLRFTLINPLQNELLLLNQQCTNDQNFDVIFDDAGDELSCPLNEGEIIRPVDSLSTYIGTNTAGNWVLKIDDVSSINGGTLLNWGLEICYTEEVVSTQEVLNDEINMVLSPNPASTHLNINIQSDKVFDGQLQVINAMGQFFHQIDFRKQSNFSHQLQTADLSPGIYFLRVVGEEGKQVIEKFVKY